MAEPNERPGVSSRSFVSAEIVIVDLEEEEEEEEEREK